MRTYIIILYLLTPVMGMAQQKIFTEADFIKVVKAYHPVARQAALEMRIAEAGLLASKGSFDPVLNFSNSGKDWDGTNYYRQSQTEMIIPTWYGIDVYAGKENVSGGRVNPQETRGTVSYMGVSVSLLQNLVIDKRRSMVKQSRLLKDLSLIERQRLVNNLLHDALITYWDWWEQYHLNELMKSALITSQKRLEMIRKLHQQGERPAMDTIEALAQVESIAIKQNESFASLVKARIMLSVFLWTQNQEQFDLPADVLPQEQIPVNFEVLDPLLNAAYSNPELTQYVYKLKSDAIEKKLKFQLMLPRVDLKYNQLANDFAKTLNPAWFQQNYRFGLSVSMPLRLSEGRGEYRIASLKLEQTRLEQKNKQAEILNKVKSYYTDWQQTMDQVNMQKKLVDHITTLQKGEETLFLNGESSLFLINAREFKTIETRQKLFEVQAKNRKAMISLKWAVGNIAE